MPTFSLLNKAPFTNGIVSGNGTFTLWTSPTQSNNGADERMRMIVDYEAATPAWPPNDASYSLSMIIEGSNGVAWFPLAYQFEPFNYAENGRQRVILLDPSILDINAGIDDIMYVGGATIARVSRQQGRLGVAWRARLVITETGHNGTGAFQSAVVSCYGETW